MNRFNCFSSASSDEEQRLIINGSATASVQVESELAVAWVGLKFYGQTVLKCSPKAILNDINGSVDLGTITALMGPSGAGKSTLLKCINGREISGIDGYTNIYLNPYVKIRSCFIVQDVKEHLLSGLTALQSLKYSSKLKNRSKDYNHELNARRLLNELNITATADTSVDNCSGGEQKRIAIALELTAEEKPNLLCIDEPTSGLDSYAAEEVIQCLKFVTQRHRISVVTSIHQPNNEIIMKFDKLYVLAKGGVCIYDGPPRGLALHLSQVGITLNTDQVPIEVLIKVSSKSDNPETQRMADLMRSQESALEERCKREGQLANGISRKKVGFSPTYHMWYLMLRSLKSTLRSRSVTILFQFALIMTLGYVLTHMFDPDIGKPAVCINPHLPQNCNATPQEIQDTIWIGQNQRLHFFALLAIQFLITVPTVLIFTNEVRLFVNEHKNGWYSTGSYFWAKTLVELPMCIIVTLCYSLVIYKSNNQVDDSFRFWGYTGVLLLGSLTAQGLGFAIGIFSDSNEKLANIMSVGVYLFNLLLCGFFAPVDDLKPYISWVKYLSFAKQSYEMEMYYLYGFDRCPNGLVSKALKDLKIQDYDTFLANRDVLLAHAVLIRVLALVILLVKANQYKCEQAILRIKKLKRYFVTKQSHTDYSPI